MKAADSNSSNQTATAATIPSWPSKESSNCKAVTMVTKPSRPDSALTEQGEETQVSKLTKEGRGLPTVLATVFSRVHRMGLFSQSGSS